MTALPPAFLARPLAHRGLHGPGVPENGLSSVRAAVEAGYGIEIDVQCSRDETAMVFHDAHLDRMTDLSGPVHELTRGDLAKARLSGGEGEGIATLGEVLATVAGEVPVLVEVKDQDGALGPHVGTLERAVAHACAGYLGPLAVMSFNPASVAELARLAPQVPRGLTTCAFDPVEWPDVPHDRLAALAQLTHFTAVGATFVSHDHMDLSSVHVRKIRQSGHPVLCWTIRSAAEEAAARRIADNVTFEGYLP